MIKPVISSEISPKFDAVPTTDFLSEGQLSSEGRYPISRSFQPFGFVGEIAGLIADLINPISGIAIQLLSL